MQNSENPPRRRLVERVQVAYGGLVKLDPRKCDETST